MISALAGGCIGVCAYVRVQWVNDLEKDAAYRSWPSSLYVFLQPSFSMLRQVRRNVANLVLLVDPLDPRAPPLLRITEALFLHQLPVRYTLLVLVSALHTGVMLLQADTLSPAHSHYSSFVYCTCTYIVLYCIVTTVSVTH